MGRVCFFIFNMLLLNSPSAISCEGKQPTYEELLKEPPEKWPGHLEPFGSKQKTVEVPVLNEWPNPLDFFQNYVEKNIPVAFKGLAKRSAAFDLFTDEFLKSFPGSDQFMITAETRKKENRSQTPLEMSFHDFVGRYHNESLYMVNELPMELKKYVLIPSPIRCDETKDLMSSQVTWFSSGGTKSVLHNDDTDNINCLYRGRKELLFIDYNKNKKFVPIDRPEGGYSSVDVDSVDYTKYPQLRQVDKYHHITMEEGDCLFIPYHWFHQVNSIANENGQNLAINVWFRHVFNHHPVNCGLPPEQATLDKFRFPDDENKTDGEEGGGEEEAPDNLAVFRAYIRKLKKKEATLSVFSRILAKLSFINPTRTKLPKNMPEDYLKDAKRLFDLLDHNKDGTLRNEDFDELENLEENEYIEFNEKLNRVIAVIEDWFEDFVEVSNQESRNQQQSTTTQEHKKEEL